MRAGDAGTPHNANFPTRSEPREYIVKLAVRQTSWLRRTRLSGPAEGQCRDT